MANPGMEGGDWRAELKPETRQRSVNKILETLKTHVATRFEERIYTEATSEQDYWRKISEKTLAVESNAASNIRNSHDSASQSLQSQVQNKVQQQPVPMVFNQSQVQQQLMQTQQQQHWMQQQQLRHQQLMQQQANTLGKDMQQRLKPQLQSQRAILEVPLTSQSLQSQQLMQTQQQLMQQQANTLGKDMQQRLNILNIDRHQKPVSSFQQGHLATRMNAMQQSQILQMKTNEGQMNFQMQPMNGSRAAVGGDSLSMTKCHLQDGSGGTKRMRQYSSAMLSNVLSSTDSMNDRFKHLTVNESGGASSVKNPRIEICLTKLDHIEEMLGSLMCEKGPGSTSSQPAPVAVLPIPSSESVVPSPEPDFPIFDAEDPLAWLYRVNSYFRDHKANESAKIELALAAMDGPTLHWMQSILRRRPDITWKKFGLELLRWNGYSNPSIVDHFESLPVLFQTGCVDEYVDMFMSRTAHVKRLPDSHSLALFMDGLRDDIRVRILSRGATNTFDAIHLALEVERELSVGTGCPGKGIVELSHAEYVELMAKGLCCKCREPCQPLRNCSEKSLRVVISAANEDGGDETMACGESLPCPDMQSGFQSWEFC